MSREARRLLRPEEESSPRQRVGSAQQSASLCAVSWSAAGTCAVWALVIWFGSPLSAQEASRQGVIVGQDGRVFSGTLSEAPGGYRVDIGKTYIVLPSSYVAVTADSLPAAYEALRDGMRKPTAEDHLLLANWCFKNELVEQARAEVMQALNLEPLRSDARQFLTKVDEKLNPPASREPRPAKPSSPNLLAPERSSAGLKRETHQEFIRRVQPLLQNRCGKECHGASAENRFRLSMSRIGSPGHRLGSESNLNAVLQFINFESPRKSLLLAKPAEPDSVHQDLFRGERNHEHFKILQRWVLQVVAETEGRPEEKLTAKPERRERLPEKIIRPVGAELPASPKSRAADEKELLEQIRKEQLPDPFDPDLFNRRVHGMSARESQQQQED